MNTKDIEEIVEHVAEVCDEVEFLHGVPVKLPSQTKALLRGRIREALTSLTQHHEAEVERAVETTKEKVKVTADDVWKVGDHYWGGDYEPSHYELTKLAESYNYIMEKKLSAPTNPTNQN